MIWQFFKPRGFYKRGIPARKVQRRVLIQPNFCHTRHVARVYMMGWPYYLLILLPVSTKVLPRV